MRTTHACTPGASRNKALLLKELAALIVILAAGLSLALPRLATNVRRSSLPTHTQTTASFPNWTLSLQGNQLLLQCDGAVLERFSILSTQQGPTFSRIIARCEFSLLAPSARGAVLHMVLKETATSISVAYSQKSSSGSRWPSLRPTVNDATTRLTCPKEIS